MQSPLVIKRAEKTKKKPGYHIWSVVPYMLILVIFIVLPLLFIIFYSLVKRTSTFPIYRITISNYTYLVENKKVLISLFKSLYFALASTGLCLLVSYPLAYFISKRGAKTQATLMLLVTAPMWINMLLRTLALKQVLDGPILRLAKLVGYGGSTVLGNDVSIIFGMTYLYIPYMILPIYTILSKLDGKLLEASTDLGASNTHSFLHVTLPLSLPGIMSGFTIVFLSSATTIVISKYLGGGKYNLIGNIIETEFITNSNWGYGSSISIILLIVIMLLMWLTSFVSRKYEGGEE